MNEKAPSCDCEHIDNAVVSKATQHMLAEEEVNGLSTVFKIFGDPTRIRIMWALQSAEMCVCELATALNMSKSAISHQLSTLKQVKLVKFRREGKNVFYSLDDEHVSSIIQMGLTHIKE